MNTYEIFSKIERQEIYGEFENISPFWSKQDNFVYESFEAGVVMDIDPHLPLRCAERFVSADTFFLVMETFFDGGIDEETGEELPSVYDLEKGDFCVITDTKNKISFVFQYQGYNEYLGKDEVLAKTVVPFLGFEKQRYREGNKVFEIKETNGLFKVCYIERTLKFK